MSIHLCARNITKRYGNRTVFSSLSIEVSSGEILGIKGSNGAGKSTLLKVLAGIQSATVGTISLTIGETTIPNNKRPLQCGYLAPYLFVYEEFTPLEHIYHAAAMRGISISEDESLAVLERLGIAHRKNDAIRSLSSGLRQRALLCIAVALSPAVLILDEPTTTLDASGRDCINSEIIQASSNGTVVLVASNDDRDLELCTKTLSVGLQ